MKSDEKKWSVKPRGAINMVAIEEIGISGASILRKEYLKQALTRATIHFEKLMRRYKVRLIRRRILHQFNREYGSGTLIYCPVQDHTARVKVYTAYNVQGLKRLSTPHVDQDQRQVQRRQSDLFQQCNLIRPLRGKVRDEHQRRRVVVFDHALCQVRNV